MKTIIEMAFEAGVAFESEEYPDIWMTYMNVGRKEIEAFAELVRAEAQAEEREACAKVADEYANGLERNYSEIIADTIRARGNT